MGYEHDNSEFVVYTNLIVGSNDVMFASAHHTADEAWEAVREWLIEEMGGTDEERAKVESLHNEQVLDVILDYDYIAYTDVAVRKVLY
jgi:putative NIF3 family GTP cyclohydrolase 1 type 2